MNNIVIEVLDHKHGQKVRAYLQSRGVEVDGYEFYCTRNGDNSFRYYGVIKGKFNNYSLEQVERFGVKIITLDGGEIISISRENAKRFHNIACNKWKKIIFETFSVDPFADIVDVDRDLVLSALKEADAGQKVVILGIIPELAPKVKPFPKLMKSELSGNIVFFSQESMGMLMEKGPQDTSSSYLKGYYSTGWSMSGFDDYEGEIVLK